MSKLAAAFVTAAPGGDELKAAAEKSVPVIQNHLEEAKSILSSLK